MSKYRSRKFLNPLIEYLDGSIVLSSKGIDSCGDQDPFSGVDASIRIRDCNNEINLDFDLNGWGDDDDAFDRHAKNNLAKVTLLIQELKQFRVALKRHYSKCRKARRRRKAAGAEKGESEGVDKSGVSVVDFH